MPTLTDLDNTVKHINKLAKTIKNKLYPNGKPDWMPKTQWRNINKIK